MSLCLPACSFSKAEKETLKEAAQQYARAHGFATDDLSWMQNHFGAPIRSPAAACLSAELPLHDCPFK